MKESGQLSAVSFQQKVGRNKRSVSGMDEHAGNGLQPDPGLRLRKRYVSSLK